jgi:hypothetical protein
MGWDTDGMDNICVSNFELATSPYFRPYLIELLELWEAEQLDDFEVAKQRTIDFLKANR